MSREPSASGRGGPPRLRYGLLRKLKILAIANALPLGAVCYVGWQISNGRMAIRQDVPTGEVGFWVMVLLVCCLVIGISSWFVMPTVRWIRDYPEWYFRNGSQALWLLPMIAGWGVWLATWITMTLCAIGMVALLAVGVWSLVGVAQAVHDQPPAQQQADPPGPRDLHRAD